MSRLDANTIAAYEGEGMTDLIVHVATPNMDKQRAAMHEFAHLIK